MRTVKFTDLDSLRDAGMYQCAAENSHGTTYSTAQMRVLGEASQQQPARRRVLLICENTTCLDVLCLLSNFSYNQIDGLHMCSL